MWAKEVLLAIIGLSSGAIVAGGLFSFVVSLGVVSDFADRTHTGNKILSYENAIILGGSLGNLFWIYELQFQRATWMLAVFGLFAGLFVGCWSMALAEVLNVFPIFMRRAKLVRGIPYLILSVAIGKGLGAFLFFWNGW
ncbi:MAG: stage V sporulation protein AB [Faecalimonas sp.]|nr:stage V sporulation protein AB [Faecalimonas sp.]